MYGYYELIIGVRGFGLGWRRRRDEGKRKSGDEPAKGMVGIAGRMVGREEGEDGLTNFEIFKTACCKKQNLVEPGRSISAKLHGTTVSPVTTSNFLENHGRGVTWSHAWVLGNKENFEISPFLRLGLTWVCSVLTLVFLVVRTGVTECTRCHSVSLGFTWFHLVSLGVTWCHSVSLGLGVTSLGVTWFHLVSHGVTRFHLGHLVSLGVTWFHLVSLGASQGRQHAADSDAAI